MPIDHRIFNLFPGDSVSPNLEGGVVTKPDAGDANQIEAGEERELTDVSVDIEVTDEENGSCITVSSQDSGIASTDGNCEKDNTEEEEEGMTLRTAPASKVCYLDLNAADSSLLHGGTWWIQDWRRQLCKCDKCMVSSFHLCRSQSFCETFLKSTFYSVFIGQICERRSSVFD